MSRGCVHADNQAIGLFAPPRETPSRGDGTTVEAAAMKKDAMSFDRTGDDSIGKLAELFLHELYELHGRSLRRLLAHALLLPTNLPPTPGAALRLVFPQVAASVDFRANVRDSRAGATEASLAAG